MAKSAMSNETIIAQGVRVEGEFIAEGDVIIEGELRGTITTAGDLRIGDNARVEADIRARNAVISGDVHGTLQIESKLDLLSTSKITGDVAAEILSVEAGAQVNGTIRMGQEAVEQAAPMRRRKVADEAAA